MTTAVAKSASDDRAILTLVVESLGKLYDRHIMVEDALARAPLEPSAVVGGTILYSGQNNAWGVVPSVGNLNLQSQSSLYSDLSYLAHPTGGQGGAFLTVQGGTGNIALTGNPTLIGSTGVVLTSPNGISNVVGLTAVGGVGFIAGPMSSVELTNAVSRTSPRGTGSDIFVPAVGIASTVERRHPDVSGAATSLPLVNMPEGLVVLALNEVSEKTLLVIARKSQGEECSIAPLDIDPAVIPHVRNHEPIMVELCLVANQASAKTGVPLSSVKIYLDDCYEDESRDPDVVVVVEAEIRASIQSRQKYWRVVEEYLAAAVEKLKATEKAFFLEAVSFEVSSASFET
jgi:hypothetical protein